MWVLLAILAVPLIEIGLFVTLGGAIGLWATLAWALVSAALGLVVLKGIATTGSVTLGRDMQELADPLSPIAHRVMVVMAGGLLLLPGFFTDALGILVLIPPLRTLVIRLVGRRLAKRGMVVQSTVIEGEWHEVPLPGQGNSSAPPSQWTRH
ncbi:FxsA family protein [Tabrizicola sp.]|uniref:FxsA family protein n=1 Tax=Tabrizicola sp. TaxID=2005166 RepID=UPI0035B449D7